MRSLPALLLLLVLAQVGQAQTAHSGDSTALRRIWSSLNGPNWRQHLYFPDWNASKPVRQWRGVTLNASGRVTNIEIFVSGCPIQVKGDIDTAIGRLTELRTFSIPRGFIGKVPFEISRCTKLWKLAVEHEHSTGPTHLPPVLGIMDSLRILALPRTSVLFDQLEPLATVPNKDFGTLRELSYPFRTYRVDEGGSVTLQSDVPGNFNTYQWYKAGQLLPQATGATLTLTNIQPADCQEYTVEVRNVVVPRVQAVRRVAVEMSSSIRNDSLAVVSIYRNLNGAKWPAASRANWLTAAPLSTWAGVAMQAGRVTGLTLIHDSIRGTVPDSIELLARLKSLYIFAVPGKTRWAISGRLAQLKELDYFHLYDVDLSAADLSVFGQFPGLRVLFLTNANLNRPLPDVFQNTPQLEVFIVSGSGVTNPVPTSLRNQPMLRYLSLAGNKLEGEVPFVKAQKASSMYSQGFDVRSNNFTSISTAAVGTHQLQLQGNRLAPYALNHPSARFHVTDGVFVGGQQPLENDELKVYPEFSMLELHAPYAVDTILQGFRHRFDGWFRSQGANTVRVSGQPHFSQMLTRADSGTYFYRVTSTTVPDNRSIMISARRGIVVKVGACPLTPVLAKPARRLYCQGDSVLLKTTVACVTCQYTWFWNDQPWPKADSVLVAKLPGTYKLMLRNASGCMGLSDTVAIAFNQAPVPSIISVDSVGCGQPLRIVRTAVPGARWLVDGQLHSSSSDTLVLEKSATVALAYGQGLCSKTTLPRLFKVMPAQYEIGLSARGYCFPTTGKVWVDSMPAGAMVSWFRNDTLVNGASSDTLAFAMAGTYRALVQTAACQINSYQAGIEPLAPLSISVRQEDSLLIATTAEGAQVRWYDRVGNLLGADSTLVVQIPGSVYVQAYLEGASGCNASTIFLASANQTLAGARHMTVHPNPGKGHLTLSLEKAEPLAEVELVNVLGQRQWLPAHQAGASQLSLDATGLANGLYLIRVPGYAPVRWIKE